MDPKCRDTIKAIKQELIFFSPARGKKRQSSAFGVYTNYQIQVSNDGHKPDDDHYWEAEVKPEAFCAIDELHHRSLASFVDDKAGPFLACMSLVVDKVGVVESRGARYKWSCKDILEGPCEVFASYGPDYWAQFQKPKLSDEHACISLTSGR